MATHSSILAWGVPRTEEPARLQCMGSQRVGHDWVINNNNNTTLNSWPVLWIIWACSVHAIKGNIWRLGIFCFFPQINRMVHGQGAICICQWVFIFCCCSDCLWGQSLELHLWQPDWEPHLSGVPGDFLSACALLPGHLCRLFCLRPGAAAHRWDRSQLKWGVEGELGYKRLGVPECWED